MPFQYTLANLLAANEGAVAVLFLDDSGEVVDIACADQSPYQMKVLGAYVGIYMRQLGFVLEKVALGDPATLHIEKDGLHLFASALPDGYYLLLVQRDPAVVGRCMRTLASARDEIAREIFAQT